jgi:hypothetical protein
MFPDRGSPSLFFFERALFPSFSVEKLGRVPCRSVTRQFADRLLSRPQTAGGPEPGWLPTLRPGWAIYFLE